MKLSQADQKIVSQNINLAKWCCSRMVKTFPDIDPETVESICYEGLCRSVITHKTKPETKLSTLVVKKTFWLLTAEMARQERQCRDHVPCQFWEGFDPAQDDTTDRVEDSELIGLMFKYLRGRDRELTILRDWMKGLTLSQSGEKLGLSRERVRQILNRTLARLRSKFNQVSV